MIDEKTIFHGYEFIKGISIDHDLNDDERKELTLAIFSTMNRSLNIFEQRKIACDVVKPDKELAREHYEK